MKTRRVFVTLELETDAPIALLRKAKVWQGITSLGCRPGCRMIVHQAQANVAQSAAPKRKARRKP
jgi:hypothetical protein